MTEVTAYSWVVFLLNAPDVFCNTKKKSFGSSLNSTVINHRFFSRCNPLKMIPHISLLKALAKTLSR